MDYWSYFPLGDGFPLRAYQSLRRLIELECAFCGGEEWLSVRDGISCVNCGAHRPFVVAIPED